ncbi:hypothetical protein ACIA8C_09360 [Nocardia sp. NPDC051321]|uniref:hypothetical protein n=1 Tax=Nocardia sp. NPDC051321 TaxID=3364323 RepID=UPI0037B99976
MRDFSSAIDHDGRERRRFLRLLGGSLLAGIGATALTSSPAHAAKCKHPEDNDRSCKSKSDCCGDAKCQSRKPARSGRPAARVCCYGSGSISPDPELCCNPNDSYELSDGFYACADNA